MRSILALLLLTTAAHAQLRADGATASFKGSLPPKPTADLSAEQQASLEVELAAVAKAFEAVKKHERSADAAIFIKAVRYALDFHEWYDKKPEDGVKKATALLTEAKARIAALAKNETPWMMGSGQKVLGFYSRIDDSAQPYGVEVPEGLDYGAGKKLVPMWIWLHGRGDTATDIHFVYSRLMAKKPGQFQPAGTIVIHPFGRYCNGWKSAGETDVFEARDDATARFNVDTNRIALAGFSMGGAGAWHLGAHFADQWACVHTGAGFVDVQRYQKITPDKMPPWYEQTLWGVYDVPDYARNFFNVPLISYSGEVDAQRDSAEYMMEVLGKEGLKVPHLIGPGMGHKYHPEVIKDVQKLVEAAVAKGRDPMPRKVVLQTRTLAYNRQFWVSVERMEQQWEDCRIEAEVTGDAAVTLTTKNVRVLALDPTRFKSGSDKSSTIDVLIDGQQVNKVAQQHHGFYSGYLSYFYLERRNNQWQPLTKTAVDDAYFTEKRNASSGTIDDAFKHRFIIVLPDSAPTGETSADKWVKSESAHFIQRWRGLMRGDPVIKRQSEISGNDFADASIVLWGTPQSNSMIQTMMKDKALPFDWNAKSIAARTQPAITAPSTDHILSLGYRNSWGRGPYVVLNSGLTFREAHDKTNSLQNPKLPDWAILDITQPPTAESAGKAVAADFFDEHWQVKPTMRGVDER